MSEVWWYVKVWLEKCISISIGLVFTCYGIDAKMCSHTSTGSTTLKHFSVLVVIWGEYSWWHNGENKNWKRQKIPKKLRMIFFEFVLLEVVLLLLDSWQFLMIKHFYVLLSTLIHAKWWLISWQQQCGLGTSDMILECLREWEKLKVLITDFISTHQCGLITQSSIRIWSKRKKNLFHAFLPVQVLIDQQIHCTYLVLRFVQTVWTRHYWRVIAFYRLPWGPKCHPIAKVCPWRTCVPFQFNVMKLIGNDLRCNQPSSAVKGEEPLQTRWL